jgi:dienelactone hydrolase
MKMITIRVARFVVLASALHAALAAGQQLSAPQPSRVATELQNGADVWIAPPGVQVSVDRRSGRVSMSLPIQPIDGSKEQKIRFEEWRLHPYAGTGDFPATREESESLPTHTVYRPADLAKAPKLPILLWANGGCRNTSVEFTRFLGEIASHGYLVVAVGRSNIPFMVVNYNGGLGITGSSTPTQSAAPLQMYDPSYMIRGLDWAIAENSRRGSELYGKLATTEVAALGQSCGGEQAFRAAKDSRVKTVMALNGGFPTAEANAVGRDPDPDWTAEKLAVPAALFEGGPADLAYFGAERIYKALPATLPVLKANLILVGHTGAYPMPDIRWTKGVLAWLDWTLKGDTHAMRMFAGAECLMCADSDWWIETKNIH